MRSHSAIFQYCVLNDMRTRVHLSTYENIVSKDEGGVGLDVTG
jgi:hypothetical protein